MTSKRLRLPVLFVNMKGYTRSCFCWCFHFVSNVHFMQCFAPRDITASDWTTQHGVNVSSASECYDWPRAVEFWISKALDWPGVDVLRHRVLNSYMPIPVIFILRSHTASFCQFTVNVTTSHTGKLPEWIYWYFWKGPVHTWSLYGNLQVIFQ